MVLFSVFEHDRDRSINNKTSITTCKHTTENTDLIKHNTSIAIDVPNREKPTDTYRLTNTPTLKTKHTKNSD